MDFSKLNLLSGQTNPGEKNPKPTKPKPQTTHQARTTKQNTQYFKRKESHWSHNPVKRHSSFMRKRQELNLSFLNMWHNYSAIRYFGMVCMPVFSTLSHTRTQKILFLLILIEKKICQNISNVFAAFCLSCGTKNTAGFPWHEQILTGLP